MSVKNVFAKSQRRGLVACAPLPHEAATASGERARELHACHLPATEGGSKLENLVLFGCWCLGPDKHNEAVKRHGMRAETLSRDSSFSPLFIPGLRRASFFSTMTSVGRQETVPACQATPYTWRHSYEPWRRTLGLSA
ncbi:hypothetical protein ElyMa_002747800 [Elysia marginata]|uniref:Uncharacterized protein n=1 Tax=Elysia marginata TaxID=1093978 RepID=A0AAV4HK87_9GAST|nr:hypothetical protein ElyMa_002747800 [Elysia marginata]